jgi:hypothetical protein
VFVLDAQGRPIDQIETDRDGAFFAQLRPGRYRYVVVKDDRTTTPGAPIEITANLATGVFVEMAPPSTIVVTALDELGRHAPAKIQLMTSDDRVKSIDGRNILYSLQLGEAARPTSMDGTGRYLERSWWTVDGRLTAPVRPGTYDIVVSRGPEYELTTKTVTLEAGTITGA